jgi:hypothetical protein
MKKEPDREPRGFLSGFFMRRKGTLLAGASEKTYCGIDFGA